MLRKILKERNIPKLKSRDEMLDILYREEYGYLPPTPTNVTWEIEKNTIPNFCAGKARLDKVNIISQIGSETFSFPVYVALPTKKGKYPFFIHINFRDNVPDRYMPTEEIIDNGFAIISFYYKDVTMDDNDFTNGLAGVLYKGEERSASSPGKIAMWAWAAHRAMDYAQTLDCLDTNQSIVCGHSRLGKTALLAAASDERFKYGYSNDSGCSGAAITRKKQGEDVATITKTFPFWFCKNYFKYANNEDNMSFDQHYLLASIAPKRVYIASAEEDIWADPESEFLSCVSASEAYERQGLRGFVCNNELPSAGDLFHEGMIGYHVRGGSHYFSREDWLKFIAFFNNARLP